MRAEVSKYLNGITLIGVGGVLLAFWIDHRIDQYLHPLFRPGVLAGGILLVLAGTLYCVTTASRRCCVAGECVHEASQSPVRSFAAGAVLLAPLVTGSLVSKDAFDRNAVMNRSVVQDASALVARSASAYQGSAAVPQIPATMLGGDIDETASRDASASASTPAALAPGTGGPAAADPNAPGPGDTADGENYLPRTADGNVALEVTDLLYGEAEPSLRKVFSGKTVEVVGQYLPSKQGRHFKLVRMLIVCCAADARPMLVNVETDRPVQQTDMAWVKVVGKPLYQDIDGKTRVTLRAAAVMPVDPPADAMLY
ncbi:MAG: DUF1980 domain-containing protein [Verrucomicrobia bacterium]|nr:DUF1980 domain-containing protein [Verrucomicrobiota bacterium]